MAPRRIGVFAYLIIFLGFFMAGCAATSPGSEPRSADTGKLEVENVRKKEVLDLLGEPAERRDLGGGNEEWIYYNVKKSLLLDNPLPASRQRKGRQDDKYDVIRVTFGPVPGWAPGIWWGDFKKFIGIPEKTKAKEKPLEAGDSPLAE